MNTDLALLLKSTGYVVGAVFIVFALWKAMRWLGSRSETVDQEASGNDARPYWMIAVDWTPGGIPIALVLCWVGMFLAGLVSRDQPLGVRSIEATTSAVLGVAFFQLAAALIRMTPAYRKPPSSKREELL